LEAKFAKAIQRLSKSRASKQYLYFDKPARYRACRQQISRAELLLLPVWCRILSAYYLNLKFPRGHTDEETPAHVRVVVRYLRVGWLHLRGVALIAQVGRKTGKKNMITKGMQTFTGEAKGLCRTLDAYNPELEHLVNARVSRQSRTLHR